MATIAEIKALIDTRVRALKDPVLTDGVAEILDLLADGASDGGGGGPTIYSADGILAGIRVVDLNGHNFRIEDVSTGLTFLMNIGDKSIHMTNSVGSALAIDNDADNVEIQYKDPTTSIYLGGGSSQITYAAGTHTFNTGITVTDLAGVGTRAIAVDTNGKIVLL